MNTSITENQTSYAVKCSRLLEGVSGLVVALDFIIQLFIQAWVLRLGMKTVRTRGHLPSSEILTMALAAQELLSSMLNPIYMVAFAFNIHTMILFVLFFSGIYMVGRPIMNSLICVERFIAVAHPVIYRKQDFVKHRYIVAALVLVLILAYGGFTISIYPKNNNESYILALSLSILVISACSLGVLKILLRPNPGETQKEKMHQQKKRAFTIITGTLFCISVPYGLDMLIFCIKTNIDVELACVLMASNLFFLQAGSVIQSVLYLAKHGKLSYFKKLLPQMEKNAGITGFS